MQIRNSLLPLLILVAPLGTFAAEVEKPAPEPDPIKWTVGPGTGALGTQASIKLPEGYRFAGADDTRRIMSAMGNPTRGNEMGLVMRDDADWFILFQYQDTGYVKDEEKDKLDADAILESIRKGTEEGNKVRKQNGWGTLTIDGWEIKPAYNPETHNVEWATRARDEKGNIVINQNMRLLGREGVMSAVLVASPEELATAAPMARNLLKSDYAFNSGKTYAEFRQGDKIAQYGLIGLITAGAGVVAVKSGLLKMLWKPLVVVAVAIAGFFKKLFGRKSSSPAA